MKDNRKEEWSPSRRQMEAEWYLRQMMRFIVGPTIMGWELVIDRGQNLAVLLVGAMVSSSTDVLSLVRGLIRQARFEQRTLTQLIEDETKSEDQSQDSDSLP